MAVSAKQSSNTDVESHYSMLAKQGVPEQAGLWHDIISLAKNKNKIK